MPVIARDVQKIVRRILDGLDNLRMSVSRTTDGNPGREVEEAVAIDVPNFRSTTFRHYKGIVTGIRGRADETVAFDQRLRLRTR